jgi:hypothetical protein
MRKKIGLGILSIMLAVYSFVTIVSLADQIDSRIDTARNPILAGELNHIPASLSAPLLFLKTQPFSPAPVVVTQPNDVQLELLIPIFSDKITFVGHPLHTMFASFKEQLVANLFAGKMSETEFKTFVTNHRVGYLITSSDQTSISKIRYTLLKQIYQNERLTIFAVTRP